MSEPVVEEEETTSNTKLPSSSTAVNDTAPIALVDRDSLMMMDLDGSWTFDQIFTSDPTSPFLLSDQAFSPLWAFPDDNDVGNVTSTLAGGVRLSDYSRLLPPCDPDSINETHPRNDEKRRIAQPVLGFVPLDFSNGSCVIKERMTQALRYFKESTEQHVLAQVWAPVKNGDRYVLTTSGQPFVLDPNSNGLHQYRMASVMYMFSVDEESDGGLGLPGRVFQKKLPEWTPNVQFYSCKEYPRLNHALHYNVRGTLALPVFEPSGQSCVAVLELIMTSQKINYASEVDKVCKALESSHTGNDNYILEFFMAPDILECNNKFTLLDSLLATMKQQFRSLMVASGKELNEKWRSVEIIKGSMDGKPDFELESVQRSQSVVFLPESDTLPNEGDIEHLDSLGKKITKGFDAVNVGNVAGSGVVQNDISLSENKESKKKSQRKRGKAEKSISLEVLQQYFSGSLKNAAKSLGVCPTTMKRICRQHGISRWPSRKINKVNRSLSKLKRVIESVQGAEGAFTLNSLASGSLPAGVGSMSWPASLHGSNEQNLPLPVPSELPEENNEFHTHQTPGSDGQDPGVRLSGVEEYVHLQNGRLQELGVGSNRSKTDGGSRDESIDAPTSHASCQGSPQNDQVVSHLDKQSVEVGASFELACLPIEGLNLSTAFSVPDVLVTTETEEPFGGMLIEDAGSSHDLRNLCPAGGAFLDESIPECNWTNHPSCEDVPKESMATPAEENPHFSARTEVKTVTIKATYREDIIRFRLSLSCGILKLQEEVAKRLKLEVGTFDVKYLDDDHEWVLIACDADLEECVDISRSSGRNIIRLLVNDIMANLGSSCESSG